jgi:hypothetical protein
MSTRPQSAVGLKRAYFHFKKLGVNVRSGSKTEVGRNNRYVRFGPTSGRIAAIAEGQLRANNGLLHRIKNGIDRGPTTRNQAIIRDRGAAKP